MRNHDSHLGLRWASSLSMHIGGNRKRYVVKRTYMRSDRLSVDCLNLFEELGPNSTDLIFRENPD